MTTKKTMWVVGLIALLVVMLGVWKNRETMGLSGAVAGSSKMSRQAGVAPTDTVQAHR